MKSTFQLSSVLLTWKSDESALSASSWLLKQPKHSSVLLFSLSCNSCCQFYFLSGCQNSTAKLFFNACKCDHVAAASSSRSSLVTGPSQNRLQIVNRLSQSLPWLISCLSLWPFHRVVLLQTHGYFLSHVNTKPFGQRCSSYCVPRQWNSPSSDIHHIQCSHAFKTAFKTHLCKQYYNKWF